MSYILDALKKSEKERRRGEVPDIMTVQGTAAALPKSRRIKGYAITAVLLLASGLSAWQFGAWQVKKPAIAPQPPASPEPTVRKEAARDITASGQEAVQLPGGEGDSSGRNVADNPPAGNKPALARPPVKQTDTGNDRGHTVRSDLRRPAVQGRPSIPPLRPEAVKTVPPHKIFAQKDLPQAVLQGLPPIAMSVHYYDADPELRMVRMNGQTVREGGEIAPGLTLEEITPSGAVLSFQGYRFRTGLPK